jgi:hypothetical protein
MAVGDKECWLQYTRGGGGEDGEKGTHECLLPAIATVTLAPEPRGLATHHYFWEKKKNLESTRLL